MRVLQSIAFFNLLLWGGWLVGPSQSVAQSTSAPEFRLDSKVFVGRSPTATSRNKTLFVGGIIFDFPQPTDGSPPTEIVIYDSTNKAIHLLDMQRQVQLRLLDLQIEKLLTSMRKQLSGDQRSQPLVTQKFTETLDVANQSLKLAGDQNMTYRITGITPADNRILVPYYEFLDVFTRVQVSDPVKFPPLARIRVNQSIRQTGWLAKRVDVSIKANSFFKSALEAHSEHQLSMKLTARDREEIDLAKRNWAAFPQVNLTKYRQLPENNSWLETVVENAKKDTPNTKTK